MCPAATFKGGGSRAVAVPAGYGRLTGPLALITWWKGSVGRQVSVSSIAMEIETAALAASFQPTVERVLRDARQDSLDAAYEMKWSIGRLVLDDRP